MTICERMFLRMEEVGCTASALSRAIGSDPRVVGNWKKRNTDPPMMYALKIADALGTSVEYLITGEDPADPGQKETAPAPVLDDRTRELVEIFSSLDDFDKGQVLGTARTLWAAAEKKGGMMPGGIAG